MSLADALTYHMAYPEHQPFIIGSWMRAMRRSPDTLAMDDDAYYTWARGHVSQYVAAYPTVVALDPEDTDTVIGYLNYNGLTGNFAYVRKDFRKQKIYEKLKELTGIKHYSHRSEFWKHARGGLSWTPFWLL